MKNLKTILAILFFLLIGLDAIKASKNSGKPKNVILRFPAKTLGKRLTKNCTSDSAKAYAIYHWMVTHIKYDVRAYEKNIFKERTYKQIIRRKKGICEDYADLFQQLCSDAGLNSIKVFGYTKTGDYFEGKDYYFSDHSWNIVQIDSTWKIIETTWGSGSTYYHLSNLKKLYGKVFHKVFLPKLKFKSSPNYDYFFANAFEHNQKAIPIISEMQTLNCTIDLYTFEKKDTSGLKSIFEKNSKDTCIHYDKYLNMICQNTQNQINVSIEPKVKQFNPRDDKHKFISDFNALEDIISNRNLATKYSWQDVKRYDKEILVFSDTILSVSKKLNLDINANLKQHLEYNKYRNKSILNNISLAQKDLKKYLSSARKNYSGNKFGLKRLKYNYKLALRKAARPIKNQVDYAKRTSDSTQKNMVAVKTLENQIAQNDSTLSSLRTKHVSKEDSIHIYRALENDLYNREAKFIEKIKFISIFKATLNGNRFPIATIEDIYPYHLNNLDSLETCIQTLANYRKKTIRKLAKDKKRTLSSENTLLEKNLRLLAKIKKLSFADKNEDSRAAYYISQISRTRYEIADYNKRIYDDANFYMSKQKREIKLLSKTLSFLNGEQVLENLRYQHYDAYEKDFHRKMSKFVSGNCTYINHVKTEVKQELKTLAKANSNTVTKNLHLKKI